MALELRRSDERSMNLQSVTSSMLQWHTKKNYLIVFFRQTVSHTNKKTLVSGVFENNVSNTRRDSFRC